MNIFRFLGTSSPHVCSASSRLLRPAYQSARPWSSILTNRVTLTGDLSHLASIFILLHKIYTSRSCRGISFKTQALYLAVFLTRYVDLLTGPYVSLYNTVMKLFFIGSTGYTLYLMKFRFRYVVVLFLFWRLVGRVFDGKSGNRPD